MKKNKYGTAQRGFYSHFWGANCTVKKEDDTQGKKLNFFSHKVIQIQSYLIH